MSWITDADLLRERRPVAELRRALLAPQILRLARLRGLGKFTKKDLALAALDRAAPKAPSQEPA